ncbi:hypothetical protein BDF19DRAFT_440204 [Syncephalis fuscata]|nr:hypothetical protein BDF19DRAFT_440204 [Syncephalis fuscata]
MNMNRSSQSKDVVFNHRLMDNAHTYPTNQMEQENDKGTFHPPRQYNPLTTNNDGSNRKGSSQTQYKSLTLWPIPLATRYALLITVIVSTLAAFNLIHVYCSAPSYVIYHEDIGPLLLSPWYTPLHLSSLLVTITNFILLAIFEKSLTQLLGGTRRLIVYWLLMLVCILSLRQLLGYLFCRGTGWAFPALFFNDSVHECSYGLAPLLAASLMLQALRIRDKYIIYYGRQSHQYFTIYKLLLQLSLLFLNYFTRNILWWSITGLIIGLFAALIVHPLYMQDNDEYAMEIGVIHNNTSNGNSNGNGNRPASKSSTVKNTSCRQCLYALMQGLRVATLTMILLLISNAIYTHQPPVNTVALGKFSEDPYFLSLVVLSAPRRTDPDFLLRTLKSFLAPLPDEPASNSFYTRIRIVVYTHFSNHSIYDRARREIGDTPKGRRYIKWLREEGSTRDQRLHMSRALDLVATDKDGFSEYIGLVEDDFPLCGDDAWQLLLRVLWEANVQRPNHCGVFVGTGGTGLIMHRKVAIRSAKLLQNPDFAVIPPDVLLQDCLLGRNPLCSFCNRTLTISRTILMQHLGYNTSTSNVRSYGKEMYQCGWRHPFNGDPDILTI